MFWPRSASPKGARLIDLMQINEPSRSRSPENAPLAHVWRQIMINECHAQEDTRARDEEAGGGACTSLRWR